jgi:hypothetical protein
MCRSLIRQVGIVAAICCLAAADSARADILLAGFEDTLDTAIPGLPFHKDLTPDPPDATGPDILQTSFVHGGPEQGVTQGNAALQIDHPTDWGTDEFYLELTSQGVGNAGELQFLDLIAQTTAIQFDITTFGADNPQYRQIFIVFNTNYLDIGWYDANPDADMQRDFPSATAEESFHTETVTLDISAPIDQAGAVDNRAFIQALAQLAKADNEDGTPVTPDLSFQLYLVFQGLDEPFKNPVRIVMDNFRLIGPTAPGLPGDYNDDTFVDAADYTVWRNNLHSTTILPNDDTPGAVEADDFTRWKNNFGAHSGSGSLAEAVPEPSCCLMVLVFFSQVGTCFRARR